MSKTCNCKKPPGGGVDCPDNCLAICRLQNGECWGSCQPIPSKLSQLQFNNWILGTIKNEEDRFLDLPISYQDQLILESKRFTFFNKSRERIVIRFSFPDIDQYRGMQKN